MWRRWQASRLHVRAESAEKRLACKVLRSGGAVKGSDFAFTQHELQLVRVEGPTVTKVYKYRVWGSGYRVG